MFYVLDSFLIFLCACLSVVSFSPHRRVLRLDGRSSSETSSGSTGLRATR